MGTPEYLIPTRVEPSLTEEDKRKLRRLSGCEDISYEGAVEDYTLRGLSPLLKHMANLASDLASERAKLLWQALRDVQQYGGRSAFYGEYRWAYCKSRSAEFPARSVETLNSAAWVPDKDGKLQPPSYVVFQDTGWEKDPALEAKIRFFKPAVIKELAEAAGIELRKLELIREHDFSESELMELVKLRESRKPRESDSDAPVSPDSPAGGQERKPAIAPDAKPGSGSSPNLTGTTGSSQNQSPPNPGSGPVKRPKGYREYVTYVKVDHKESDEDPDGLTREARMDLESKAIDFILDNERDLKLKRAPEGNPGYDLWKPDNDGKPVKYIEVKAMSGTFDNRAATLSKTQFEFAQKHPDAFWLYVVENAGDPAQRNLVRIKNPAGKAQTFTFDRGWRELQE